MNPEQQSVYEQIESDLKLALDALSQPHMDDATCIREVRELVKGAHEIIGSILLAKSLNHGPDPELAKAADRRIEIILDLLRTAQTALSQKNEEAQRKSQAAHS
jgi:hypothetical protein